MKTYKRTFTVMLAVVMLMTTLAFPVSAATNTTWQNAFADFPELYQGHSSKGYIKLIQRFLYCYSDETHEALTAGGSAGIDGGFGPKTETAVKYFQDDFLYTSDPLVVDGRPGAKTWRKIAQQLDASYSGRFRIKNRNDLTYYNVLGYSGATATTHLYNYTAGGSMEESYFDTINLYSYQ